MNRPRKTPTPDAQAWAVLAAFATLRRAYAAVARGHRGCPGCDLCNQVTDTMRLVEMVASGFCDLAVPPDDPEGLRVYRDLSRRWA
jgi:hypothetical protein